MDENKTQLSELLNEPEHRQTIISIVGMGGLGKTTLATKVYNDQEVQRDFECCAWISLSQAHGIELLRSMVREFLKADQVNIPNHLGSMNYRQLIEMLIEYLRSRRYLVVLDDVWAIDPWSRIRKAFPENNIGSRIILTTRNKNVATSIGPGGRVFHLEPLNEDDAWTAFCKKAFAKELNHFCPSELEALARSMLTKCQGLPLAIVAIGGLMCTKDKTVAEWKKVNDSLNWQLSNNPMLERVKGILALSFNDLPFYLKYCFLYCCVFPEGYPIKRKKLIRLWIAEGLVGQLNALPHWLGSLQNLTHLHLGSSLSEENILPPIDELPILVFLELQNAYNGKILHFRARGFPKLNSLKLLEFEQLEGICLAEGALPSLRELHLIHCKKLKQLPQGIEHIASIRKLHLEEMPEELIQNLRINGSKDQAKVQHIQTINHVYKIEHIPILETLS